MFPNTNQDTREVTIQAIGRGRFEVVYDTGTKLMVMPDETVTVSKPFTVDTLSGTKVTVGELNVRMRFLAPPKIKTKRRRKG